MPLLELNKVHFERGDFSLKGISFKLAEAENISILGLSGSGKSSLLSVIYGLHDLSNGEVLFNKERVQGPSEILIPGHKKMKLVNQDFGLDKFHKVGENISNNILHLEKDSIETRTDELLEVINLKEIKQQQANTLSGGQKQRLSIGRALAELPELLLLDEPFSQIDYMNKFQIERKLWAYLKENKMASIMVTHDFQDAFTISDRILIMKEGELINDTHKTSLYNSPESHYEAMITGGYNTVIQGNKKYNFRKNEYAFEKSEKYSVRVPLQLSNRIDIGAKQVFYGSTKSNEIILESSFNIPNFIEIYIPNKTYKFDS